MVEKISKKDIYIQSEAGEARFPFADITKNLMIELNVPELHCGLKASSYVYSCDLLEKARWGKYHRGVDGCDRIAEPGYLLKYRSMGDFSVELGYFSLGDNLSHYVPRPDF